MSEISKGTRFGPYEIVSQIGEGGMGAVYRASDTRLGRSVAVKISAQKFSERFERESRAVAALNHPNICTLHDVGPDYLVMELVEGQTLEERIKQGALPLDEAVQIARQIVAALEAAHDKGIVHRDLKPANIKVKPDGTVKVLDFGLARMDEPVEEASEAKTMGGSIPGMILGTAGYMAPEQARGLIADKRADIWAFGVVFYEMLTGQGSFHAPTVPDMLAAVLTREPDLSHVPAEAQTLLRRCLEKDPQRRLRDIGDALPLLGLYPQTTKAAETKVEPARRSLLWPAVAAVAGAAALLLGFLYLRAPSPTAEPIRFSIALPRRVSLTHAGGFAISPDGRKIAFAAIGSDGARRIWVRPMDSLEWRVLQEAVISNPNLLFWSADSRFIAYQDNANNLMRIDAEGGAPTRVAGLPQGAPGGGSWGAGDVIIFGTGQGVMQVPADGGTPVLVTKTQQGTNEIHWNPKFGPDGKRFHYLSIFPNQPEKLTMRLGSIDLTPEQQKTDGIPEVVAPEYVPPSGSAAGKILYLRGSTLLARDFDFDAFELRGEPVTVAEDVGFSNPRGQALFSVSSNGVLLHRPNPPQDAQFTWFNRRGEMIGRIGDPGLFGTIALSPDGTRAATSRPDLQTRNQDIWVFDLVNGGSNRLTFNPGVDQQPLWSRDGNRLVYASNREDGWSLYQKLASGAGDEDRLLKADQVTNVTDWSRDGRYMIYHTGRNPRDIWILPLTGDRKPFPFIQTAGDDFGARFSPDGKWVLYVSNESGVTEIYVQPMKTAAAATIAGKWMISKGTVGMPRWRGDGKEIFYLAPDGNVMAAEVVADVAFRALPAKALFQVPPIFLRTYVNPGAQSDVAYDGQRFLFAMPVLEALGEELNVAMNWRN
jgi:Tol biopolymer transport system component